jgi:hypothetical protein
MAWCEAMRRPLLALLALCAFPASAAAVTAPDRIGPAEGNFDVRTIRTVPPEHAAAVAALRAQLGVNGVVSVDARNGALRDVGRLDGFLTGPSTTDPARVALGFVRRYRAAFGLTRADIDGLVLVRRIRSGEGLQRLFWQQRAAGVPALDSGLRANLTADGRLINIAGSPVSGIAALRVAPTVTGAQARAVALEGVGAAVRPSLARVHRDARATTTFRSGDQAALGVLAGATNRVVWDTTVQADARHTYRVVVDARTGRTLLRRSLVQNVAGSVHLNYPGAAVGGTQQTVAFPAPWLPSGPTKLLGPNAYVFADTNDNDLPDAGDDIGPSSPNTFAYPLLTSPSTLPNASAGACTTFPCTWDPHTGTTSDATRLRNKGQSGTQAFFFVNTFHDWLALPPISFTTSNGGFQDVDPVIAKVLDGAQLRDPTTHLAPDEDHIDNADMLVPPDGTSPIMRMFLWHATAAPWTGKDNDPFLPANGADEADIVYHEYTHGLSNRLVVDSLGQSTLLSHQANSMGEAWSDWYAMDYLTDPSSCGGTACFADGPGADVRIGEYISLGKVGGPAIRFQAIDCAVGSTDAVNCHSPHAGVPLGGLTYASLGRIDGTPEVHSDGEIWAQTLWDLRAAVGAPKARMLVTRAMELAPDDPSFLDMRNAILQADTALNGAAARGTLWSVFAHRGMGFFAGTLDGADTHPVASFATPPAATAPQGRLSGTLIDIQTHAPVRRAHVSFAGLDSGFPNSAGADTSASGKFAIRSLPAGAYPYLTAGGAGYEQLVVKGLTLRPGPQVRQLKARRGWALLSGGGTIRSFTKPDFSDFGCGPTAVIDGSLGSGWASALEGGPATVTIKLPATVNVTDIAVDPGATCGDGPDAGTKQFVLQTSRDGKRFHRAKSGQFTITDQGHLNRIIPARAARSKVRYVRLQAVSNFGNFDPTSGVRFIDVSEIAVHGIQVGRAHAVISGPRRIRLGRTVTFTSRSSSGVGRSPIVRRSWSRAGARTRHSTRYRLHATRLGTIRLKLTVTDFRGRKGTVTKVIRVVP